MTYSFWANIAETPWWFYVLFFVFIKIGLQATKPRIINAKYLFISPIISLSIFILSICTFLTFNLHNFFICLGGFSAGLIYSILQLHLLKVRAVKDQAKIYIPGSWLFLLLTSGLFVAKSYYGFQITLDPTTLDHPEWVPALYFLFGFGIGGTGGRSFYIIRRFKKGPFVTLQGEPA